MNKVFQGAMPPALGSFQVAIGRMAAALVPLALLSAVSASATEALDAKTRVLFERHCLNCHSTAKHKGDLDLERFVRPASGPSDPKVWQQVLEQVSLGEMPPRDQPAMACGPSSTGGLG